jgi:predicted DCC family thiol-disulfide oxidoreductase YuxK
MTGTSPPGEGVLVFDGACGFCRRSVRWLYRLRATCPSVPYQEVDLSRWDLSVSDAADAAWFVADGRRWRGHEAIAQVLRSSTCRPVMWLGWLLGTRVARPLASRAYAWVSANRSRLP